MASHTSHAVRLEKRIVDKIRPIAAANRRTVKGQIEVILNAAIREAALRKPAGGFTVIELVNVVASLGVLAAVAITCGMAFHRRSVVHVGDKVVFEGRAFCVEVKSAGAATEIDLRRGPLCLLPGDHYVGNDIRVETH